MVVDTAYLRNLFLSGLPFSRFLPKARTPFSFVQAVVGDAELVAVDLGARGDIQPGWLVLDGIAKIHGFEPDRAAVPAMRAHFDRRGNGHLYAIHEIGVSAEAGPRKLYVNGPASGASIYPMQGDVWERYGGIEDRFTHSVDIETALLDDVLDEAGVGRVSMIKLDIQGAELEVLRSLRPDRVAGLDCIEAEVIVPDDGIRPNLIDYLAFFRDAGFELYDARTHRAPIHAADGVVEHGRSFGVRRPALSVSEKLWEFDVVLFRPLDQILAAGDVARLRTAIACLCTYNFFGEALWLAKSPQGTEMLGSDAAEVQQAITRWHATLRRKFLDRDWPGIGALVMLLKALKLGNRLRWARSQWVGHPSA